MTEDLVSVITPSYNAERTIGTTIESVLQQTYSNWELIIVDDGSTDATAKVVTDYGRRDSRIQFISQATNLGAAMARNHAIRKSKGRFIAFLDSDDVWKPEKLSCQISFMKKTGFPFTYTLYETIDEAGAVIRAPANLPPKVSYAFLLRACRIGCLTVVYDTHEFGKVSMPLISRRQDYGLWLNLLRKVPFAYCLRISLAQYRITPGSISRNKVKLLKYNYALLRIHQKLPLHKALFYLMCNIGVKVFSR